MNRAQVFRLGGIVPGAVLIVFGVATIALAPAAFPRHSGLPRKG